MERKRKKKKNEMRKMVEIFVQFAIEKKITLRRRENLKTFILRERKKKIIRAMDFNEWAKGQAGRGGRKGLLKSKNKRKSTRLGLQR